MVGDVTRNRGELGEMSVPFALSLAAGILIIFSSTIVLWIGAMFGNGGFMGGMMNGDSMMGDNNVGFNNFLPFMTGILSVGIVSGILVLIGALMMYYKRSEQAKTWGIVVLIFSIVALIGGGGGFLIGTILGIIGGALAISRAR
jgi:uncharacterized membrane protein YhaH (DUF805 family)